MRVLITEDSELIQSMYEAVLIPLGVDFEFAAGVEESRAKFAQSFYDLVFFDVDLGHATTTGKDLLCEYRSLYPEGRVYMATSHDEDDFHLFCQRVGAEVIKKGSRFVQSVHAALINLQVVA